MQNPYDHDLPRAPDAIPDERVRMQQPAHAFSEICGASEMPILLAVPHSGRFYPAELTRQAKQPIEQLRRLEDPLVDQLIVNTVNNGTGAIIGHYARAWIDLNRRETEIDPRQISPSPPAHVDHRSPRVMAGLGLVPQTTGNGRNIYDRPLPLESLNQRIREAHRPYHARIATLLAAIRARHGTALLCDMHSMPSLPGAQAADIVIGDRFGRTAAPWLVDSAAEWLIRQGYRVARNTPYAGGHCVEHHGRPTNAVHAIQFEIDRRLYLNAGTLSLNENAGTIAVMIAALIEMLRTKLLSNNMQRLAAE